MCYMNKGFENQYQLVGIYCYVFSLEKDLFELPLKGLEIKDHI